MKSPTQFLVGKYAVRRAKKQRPDSDSQASESKAESKGSDNDKKDNLEQSENQHQSSNSESSKDNKKEESGSSKSKTDSSKSKSENSGGNPPEPKAPSEMASHVQGHKDSEPKSENREMAKLETIVKETEQVLAKATAVFPFNLFPDTVLIDHHKLSIIYRQFFNVSQRVSVPIVNIKNIQANCGPVFGSLIITSDHFVNNTQEVHWLWRSDALKIQRLVQGVMVAGAQGIDVTKISADELVDQLDKLGGGEPPKGRKPLT